MNDYRHLMENLYLAHQNFQREWREWRNGKQQLKGYEPESVTAARNKLLDALNLLYNTKLMPLETKFRANPESAVDEIIEFLSIDIPAFRCGYAKEWFLKNSKAFRSNLQGSKNCGKWRSIYCRARNIGASLARGRD